MSAHPNYFVALPIALPRGALERLADPPRAVRLFAPEDVHATVAFLGAVDEASAARAFELAGDAHLEALDVTLGRVVPLGNPRRPSALSVLLDEGHEAIAHAIATTGREMLLVAGREPEHREPLPHATVARVQRKASHAEHHAALAWAKTLDFTGVRARIDRIALFTWSEDRATTLFRIVASLPLR